MERTNPNQNLCPVEEERENWVARIYGHLKDYIPYWTANINFSAGENNVNVPPTNWKRGRETLHSFNLKWLCNKVKTKYLYHKYYDKNLTIFPIYYYEQNFQANNNSTLFFFQFPSCKKTQLSIKHHQFLDCFHFTNTQNSNPKIVKFRIVTIKDVPLGTRRRQ